MHIDCLGCRIAHQLEAAHLIYEDEHVACVLDIQPFNSGHTLILPKQHYLDLEEIDEETLSAIFKASVLLSKALKSALNPMGLASFKMAVCLMI
ncbi:HIT family protein [Paenibacillus eucommiae]|uniref:Diadenosine tetraphosphate (Ap4A) HIT family hydrolase n=1 Tax=Paenibacillus eucommiae TaxID=1355755 RepID=A0ABS4ISS1_9BACL|nr:HIT family protein [Paenibacillus eucommiae]MBP1990568.1 diadenosine tetraphosphate (Ap4A) HIT family hydrolase [Paenibacillus eucommiae]